jgi:TrmH RNA methyltransferase
MNRNGQRKHRSTTPVKRRVASNPRNRSRRSAVDSVTAEAVTKFYGVQACRAIFRERRNEIKRVFVLADLADSFAELLDWSRRRGIPNKLVDREELSRIAATEHHEGVCCEAKSLSPLTLSKFLARLDQATRACVLVLEGVENPHNVGAILRTGCFFGVAGVVLISQQLATLSGATCRVAEGAAESLPIAIARDSAEVIAVLKKHGFNSLATTPHRARSIYSVTRPQKVALLFGAEGAGLSEASLEAADERVVIPRLGDVESLNVGAAVASVLAVLNQPQR